MYLTNDCHQLGVVGASMAHDDTLPLLCGLLDSHDASSIASRVMTNSDAELFVDFLLHVRSMSSTGLRNNL